MYESFELPVTYKGEELLLPAQLLHHGYINRFQITVQGEHVLFERDDEGYYRALIDPKSALNSKLDNGLLASIAKTIEELLQ